MAERFEVYKCGVCGNVITMSVVGGGQLVCCNQPMNLQDEKTSDQGMEKHVPFIANKGGKITIRIGETPHPMEQDHYIQWIETVTTDACSRKYLQPGDAPERDFCVKDGMKVRAFCNIHGLWKLENV